MTSAYAIARASQDNWPDIIKLLEEINLDRDGLAPEQFVVCANGQGLLGVGRLRMHEGCIELCSLGVREPHRKKGIGKTLVKYLIGSYSGEVFVVTDIPDYFSKLGFKAANGHPAAMEDKRLRCISEYECQNPVVMSILAK